MSWEKGKMASAALWAGVGQIAGQGLSLILFLVLARFVSKESFGMVAVSLAIIEFLRRLVLDPIGIAVLAKTGITDRDYDVAFTLLLLVGTSSALAVLVLADPIATAIGSPSVAAPLRVVAGILLAMALSAMPSVWLTRRGLFRTFALRTVLSVLIGGSVAICLALKGWGLWSLIAQQLVISLVTVVTLWTAAAWRPRLVWSWRDVKDLLGRARHISFTAFWNTLAHDTDLIIAAAMFGPTVAGVYSAAKRIMLSINMLLVNAVSGLLLPTFANAQNTAARGAAFVESVRFVGLFSAPAFVGLGVLAPEFVYIVLGAGWVDVAPILSALVASGYCLSLSQTASALLLTCGRQQTEARCSAVAAIMSVLALVSSITAGPTAMAFAFSCATFLMVAMRLRLAMNEVDVQASLVSNAIWPSLLPAVVMGLTILLFRSAMHEHGGAPWLIGLVGIPLGVSIYVGALRLLSPDLFEHAFQSLRSLYPKTALAAAK